MRIASLGLVLATAFYLMTAIVYEEGGFGVRLVVKPYPSLILLAGGGEEGAWQGDHPGEPLPWWLTDKYIPLIVGDWEGGHPWWEAAYLHGFLATLLGWPLLAGACGLRYLLRWLRGAQAR